jgi:lipopolysaccharide/colanic/teichoic acid biosynthesis glycosyltransferase
MNESSITSEQGAGNQPGRGALNPLAQARLPALPIVEHNTRVAMRPAVDSEWEALSVARCTLTVEKTAQNVSAISIAIQSKHVDSIQESVSKPALPLSTPGNYIGPFFVQPRVGKGGHEFLAYKLRTMRPGATLSQAELQRGHESGAFGKIEKDSRVTPLGQFLRRYWLDEVPQILNVLKGDLALVGWRPLTRADLYSYPDDFQKEYCKHKPALVSVLYATDASGRSEVLAEGRKYFEQMQEHPFKTKLSYFGRALWGVLVHGRRGV